MASLPGRLGLAKEIWGGAVQRGEAEHRKDFHKGRATGLPQIKFPQKNPRDASNVLRNLILCVDKLVNKQKLKN